MSGGSGQEDSAEKSFEPTEKKLADARKKGNVPKSDEVVTTAVYIGLLIGGFVAGSQALASAGAALRAFLAHADTLGDAMLGPGGRALSATLAGSAVAALSPLLLLPALAAILSLLAQRAIVVAPSKLKPQMSRISPIQGAKNKFGAAGLVEFAKRAVKLVAVSVIVAGVIMAEREAILGSARASAPAVAQLMFQLFQALMVATILIAAAIAAVDMAWVRFDHRRQLRMTLKEMRDETKESEGDPYLKGRRRRRATEIATNRMLSDVPKADVVVVNPTHYAVALRWTRAPGSAPTCVAKGQDEVAARIREVAAQAGVPIRRDPPTARALHAAVEIGQEIPPKHYRAVAAAIRFAEEMRSRARDRHGPSA